MCCCSDLPDTAARTLCPQSVKDLPILQDAPPPGGFPSIRIERRLPSTGPTGVAIFAMLGAVMGYGFYKVRVRVRHRGCGSLCVRAGPGPGWR